MALRDGHASECIRPYEISGPGGSTDDWGANRALTAWTETDNKAHIMIVTLDNQLRQIKYTGQGSVGGHINWWN